MHLISHHDNPSTCYYCYYDFADEEIKEMQKYLAQAHSHCEAGSHIQVWVTYSHHLWTLRELCVSPSKCLPGRDEAWPCICWLRLLYPFRPKRAFI